MIPDVSVIIPSYDSARTLRETLRSLERARFDRTRVEIIVVDDGSSDDTRDVLAAFAGRLPLVCLPSGGAGRRLGAAVARNAGLDVARGRVVAFTDADCVVDEGWVEAAWDAVATRGNPLVAGDTRCDEAVLFPWKMSPAGQRGITANLAFDRARLPDLRFSPDYARGGGEDVQFVLDAAARGVPLSDAPAMRVLHPARRMGIVAMARRSQGRANEALLDKRFGEAARGCVHPLLRPSRYARVSPAAALLAAAPAAGFVAPRAFLLAALAFAAWFLARGYRRCVTYRPSGTLAVSLSDRARTLVFAAVYLPCLMLARVRGSVRFRHFFL